MAGRRKRKAGQAGENKLWLRASHRGLSRFKVLVIFLLLFTRIKCRLRTSEQPKPTHGHMGPQI